MIHSHMTVKHSHLNFQSKGFLILTKITLTHPGIHAFNYR